MILGIFFIRISYKWYEYVKIVISLKEQIIMYLQIQLFYRTSRETVFQVARMFDFFR